MTTSLQAQLIQLLERKFLESFLQLLESKCMAVEEKQLYPRGGRGQKLSHALTCLSKKKVTESSHKVQSSCNSALEVE